MTTHLPRTPHSQDGEGPQGQADELNEFADVFRVLDDVAPPALDAASLLRIRAAVRDGLAAGGTVEQRTTPPASPWQRFAWASAALTLLASAGFLAMAGVSAGGLVFVCSVAAILAGGALVAIAPPAPAASLGAGLGGLALLVGVTQTGVGAPHHDIGCAVVEWLVVAAPLAAALVRTRLRRDGSVPGVAASAAGAGLSAAGVASLVCPDHSIGHLTLVHAGGVMATVLAAALIAWLVVPAPDTARV